MGLRSWIAVVATATTVAVTGWAVPADAVDASIQYCTGNGTTIDHDVPGTLVVESYSWCSLVDVTVHGSVVVASNAEADLFGTTVDGDVKVSSIGTVQTNYGSTITGSIRLNHSQRLVLADTNVGGDITGSMWEHPHGGPELTLDAGAVTHGNVDVSAVTDQVDAYVATEGATVDHNVRLSGFRAAGQGPFQVGGTLVLNRLRSLEGSSPTVASLLCDVHVASNVTIEYTTAPVVWGGYRGCFKPDSVGGSLLVHDNTGTILLSGPIGGDAVCRRNAHHPRQVHPENPALAVTIGGHGVGQCAHLADPPAVN